jgi:uncharacterized membrane protein
MALDWISSRAGSFLPFIGIALALANWTTRPDAMWAWLAAIGMFLVMVGVRRFAQLAVHRSSGDAASARRFASVNGAVVFGGLMMIIPLAVTLAHAYGAVDDPDGGRRMNMVILGAYLVVSGNALPRQVAPLSSMQCDGSRVQAFQRFAGWTWVLCGLGFLTAWLTLPIDAAEPVSTGLVVAATIITIVRALRLRRPQQHARA